jgi:hypothetical protein
VTAGTGPRAALVVALGSAVLDVLDAHGIATFTNRPGRPAGGGPGAFSELETRRSRWVRTPATYLGAAGAGDPAGTLERLIAPHGTGAGGGARDRAGQILPDGEPMDPATKLPALRLVLGASDYPAMHEGADLEGGNVAERRDSTDGS